MVFICIKCYHQTDHINYMENHLNRKKKCKMIYFSLLNQNDLIKLSSISIYNNKEHIKSYLEYLNFSLNNGIENIKDFINFYQKSIKINYELLENKRIENKIKKKYHLCYDCGFYFDNKSNVLRHEKNNRCFIKNLFIENNNNIKNIDIYENSDNNSIYDISNKNSINLIFNELEKGYLNYIKYKLEKEDIKCNLFFIEHVDDNYIIVIQDKNFKKINKLEYFIKWLNNTIEDFESIFEEMSKFIEWKTLKNKYNILLNEFNSYLQDDNKKIICLNEWSIKVYENNDKFINYIKNNKNLIENFKIIDQF